MSLKIAGYERRTYPPSSAVPRPPATFIKNVFFNASLTWLESPDHKRFREFLRLKNNAFQRKITHFDAAKALASADSFYVWGQKRGYKGNIAKKMHVSY